MEILFLIPLFIIGLCLLLVVVQVALWYGRLALSYCEDSLNTLMESGRERSDRAAYALHKRARQRAFFKWFDTKVNGHGHVHASGVNNEILEAYRQTPVLRRLIEEEVPAAIRRCVKIHRITAIAAGAVYIEEIAGEPECWGLRERVVDLVEAIKQMIEAYPLLLDDEDLIQALVTLRKRILPTCRNCPYLSNAVADAPLLCPSARMAGIRPEEIDAHGQKRKRQ